MKMKLRGRLEAGLLPVERRVVKLGVARCRPPSAVPVAPIPGSIAPEAERCA